MEKNRDFNLWASPIAIIRPFFKIAILVQRASHSSMLCDVKRSAESELLRTAVKTFQTSRLA